MYYEFDYKLKKSSFIAALGGWFEEKKCQTRQTNKWGTKNK